MPELDEAAVGPPTGTDAIAELQAAIGLKADDDELLAELADGLSEVEAQLREVTHSDVQFVNDAALHLLRAGGKRFRPLFTLLAGHFGNTGREQVVTAGAAVELVHLATLYHDDVMDEATMRRGAASANARWDNTVAILTGDFLFANASRLVASLGSEASAIIARTFEELVTGQMRETIGAREGQDAVEHYLTAIAQKTGALIATAGHFGALFSGASGAQVASLRRFGEIIGIAFQISDDIIDIASASDDLGKAQGTDLREGVRTLPMLYALADEREDPRLVELLSSSLADEALLAEALELLRHSYGLEHARATLTGYAQQARAELETLPASAARTACESIADYLAARTH